jgi:short-subunit dehydrogenase
MTPAISCPGTLEVEQFGIKVILVGPGIIKTNFFDNILKAKKAASSPYSELLQRFSYNIKTEREQPRI